MDYLKSLQLVVNVTLVSHCILIFLFCHLPFVLVIVLNILAPILPALNCLKYSRNFPKYDTQLYAISNKRILFVLIKT